ncbi:CAP domain-containing protein [Clostridium lacusfryxellense]|uniref:CAP domain-containing protein n=1 Tax=Clostridium lacusfryxellense TaxID=205328 RepID=UPI001FECC6C6|nr:CAP domain-containing protein [Clostridium lacusfryxellense]
MKKSLRALILTLGILVTTGISSAAYAQDCYTFNTIKAGDSLQSLCAKYGIELPKGLAIMPQGTTPIKATPAKAVAVKETPAKATPAKVTPVKATPVKATPVKATPVKTTPVKATTAPNLSADDKIVKEVVTLVNQERSKQGLAPLKENVKLSTVARTKSEDMAKNNYFSHTSPTYGSPFDMMKQFGITYSAAGENIAMGQPTAASVMDGWMNSPGHRANILSKDFTEIGVGIAKNANGSIYWTQQFIGK